MKVSELEDYASRDPIIKAFGSSVYGTARNVTMSGQTAVVPHQSFANTLVQRAANSRSQIILLPWSETGTVSEIPSSLDQALMGANTDPLANRDFEKLVLSVVDEARQTCGVGVYIDKSLLSIGDTGGGTASSPAMERVTRQLSRTWTGVSMPDIHDDAGMVFRSSDCPSESQLRLLYTGNPDDLFAVRLALQLAKNGGVYIKIIEMLSVQAGTSDRPLRSGKEEHTPLRDLVNGLDDFSKSFVTIEEVSAGSTTDPEVLDKVIVNGASEAGDVTVLVGRGVQSTTSGPIASSTVVEKGHVLGPVATALIARMKETKVAANMLVVQARTGAKGAEHDQGKIADVSQESLNGS